MKIFIDTEFTDLTEMDLISIALVAEDGREIYLERDDFNPKYVSVFTRRNVLALLRGKYATVLDKRGVRDSVRDWLNTFAADGATLCFDHVVDYGLLFDLLDKDVPAWLKTRNIRGNLDMQARAEFFVKNNRPEHHALFDAQANRYAYRTNDGQPLPPAGFTFQLVSDVHREQRARNYGFDGSALDVGADEGVNWAEHARVLILAGDIHNGHLGVDSYKHWPGRVLYVAGNHEYYSGDIDEVQAAIRARCEGTNMTFLECDEVVIDGVRFLGTTLWTDYLLYGPENQTEAMATAQKQLNDHRRITYLGQTFTPQDALALHQSSRAWLEQKLAEPFAGQTVVITHHGVHPNSTHPRYGKDMLNPAFVSDLTALMGKASVWVHGHVHDSFDYVVNGTRVVANPRGYDYGNNENENPQFNPLLTIELSKVVV